MEKSNGAMQSLEAKISANTVLFFDLDGTLVDTNLANFLSYKKAIQFVTKLGEDLTYFPNQRFNRSMLKNILPNLTENEYEKIIREKELCYKDFLQENKLNKTVTEILFKYSKTNMTVLVTNCRKDRALTTLNFFGLTDTFSNIFFREVGENQGKINKYINAISRLGISASSIIVFENEKAEINDAIIAGINESNIFKPLDYDIIYN